MLISQALLSKIAAGDVSVIFRSWRRATVKAGGRLHTAVGLLAIEAVDAVQAGEITSADLAASGHASREALLAELARYPAGQTYRVRLHLAGPDPRAALREQGVLSEAETATIVGALARLDRASRTGAWTGDTMLAIQALPAAPAADLAAGLGQEKEQLKLNVRKLKALGLTVSLETGYRLSPRGESLLAALRHPST